MLDEQVLLNYRPTRGYVATDHGSVPEGAMADGSYNVIIQAQNRTRIYRGLTAAGTGGREMFKLADGSYASLNDYGGTQAAGSIFTYISNSMFFIGEGEVYKDGTILVDTNTAENFTASSSLQLSPSPYEVVYTAGLAEPDAPIVEANSPTITDPTAGLMTGLYSFKIARVRALTGGRSIASVTSAVVTFSGQVARLSFPLPDSNGQDRWAVFSTKAGFGGTGLHYLVQEIAEADLTTIDGVERSYEFNIVDADLLPVLAYIDDYPPPAGDFAARVENYIVVIGAYNNAIASSIRNFPESFNPEHLAFLPKAPTAVLPDQMGSYIYISTESSVHALSVVPTAEGNPMILQTVWTDTGVAHNHNWCSVEGVLFAFVSKQGAVTMDAQGRPTSEFAVDVAYKMQDWDPVDVTVLHATNLNSVAFCNGDQVYLWNYQEKKWSSPCVITEAGDVVSGVVHNRNLLITLKNGTSFNLYTFDADDGVGSTNFKIVSPDIQPNPQARINITGLMGTAQVPNSGTYTFSAVTDWGAETKTLSHSAAASGVSDTVRSRWYLPRKSAVRVEFAGTVSNYTTPCSLLGITVFGTAEDSNVL